MAVESREDDVGDRGGSVERRLDDLAVEGPEGDTLPAKAEGRPPGDAVEVGGERAAAPEQAFAERGLGEDRFGWIDESLSTEPV